MSAQAMLSMIVKLNIQPGEIPPTIHLKQGSDSLAASMRIAAENATLSTAGTAVIKGTKDNGDELFFVLPVSDMDLDYIYVELSGTELGEMAETAGKARCTISIIDTEKDVTRENYEEYDLVTVQPFLLEVQENAA